MAVAAETEDGKRIAESLLKQLTGGEDRLKGRRMKQDFWEFAAEFKLWISGNHKPRIRGTDDAIWDRIRLIPFRVRFDRPDKTLAAQLQAERCGILRWCVEGCLNWQRSGLGTPDAVSDATAAYRDEMDAMRSFLDERCVLAPEYQVRSRELYAAYSAWCDSSGEYRISQRRFGSAMSERGFERYKNNGTWYSGLGIRDEMSF